MIQIPSFFFGVFQVALPHSLPLPRRETLQQSSSLSTVSPATVDLTLKVHRCTAHSSQCYILREIFFSRVSVKHDQSFLRLLLRWNRLVKLGRTPRVWRRILQSPPLPPRSPPVHPRTPPSPQLPCHRSLWLLLPQAPLYQVT